MPLPLSEEQRTAKRRANRTEQEIDPHPRLVEVRNTVQRASGVNRVEAAQITNRLTNAECDQILQVQDDDKKVQKLLVRAATAKDVDGSQAELNHLNRQIEKATEKRDRLRSEMREDNGQ